MRTLGRRLRALVGRRGDAGGPVVAAVLAVVLLLLVGGVALRNDTRTVRDGAVQRLRNDADAAVRALEREGMDFTRDAAAVAETPQVVEALRDPSPSTGAASEPLLRSLVRSTDSTAAFLSDATGTTRQTWPEQPEVVGRDFGFRDWHRGVVRTQRPYVSTAYRSAARGNPLVVGVAAPVMDGGTMLGSVTVLWQLQSVQAIVDGARRDAGVAITVTDQRGQPLTDRLAVAVDARGEPTGVDVPSTVREALAGRRASTEVDGSLVETAPVPSLGWTVSVRVPASEALAGTRTFRQSLAITLAVAIALVLGLLWKGLRAARRRARDRAEADAERRHLTTLFASSPIGIIEGMPDGTILAVNQAMSHMLGYSTDELLSMNATRLAHPDHTARIDSALQKVAEGEVDRYASERLYVAKDGTPVPVLVSVVVQHDEGGEVGRMVAFVVDQRRQRADADRLRSLAEAVAEREAFLTTLLDTIDVGVVATDAAGRTRRVNQFARRLHGVSPTADATTLELVAADLSGVPMADADLPLRALVTDGPIVDEHLILPVDGGAPARVVSQTRRMTAADGSVLGAVTMEHDVTAVREAEAALRASEARFRTVFDEGLTGKALVDPSGAITEVNTAFARVMQRSPEQLRGRRLATVFAEPQDRDAVVAVLGSTASTLHREVPLDVGSGDPRWGMVSMLWIAEDSGTPLLLVQLEDVTGRRIAEQRLTELALHDELTGLPNRRLLMDRCAEAFAVARGGRTSSRVAVLFVDLDGFKTVNDRNGHEAGDGLLVDVAADLLAAVRPQDTVARVGGDEFVVLVAGDDGLDQLRDLAARIGTVVRRRVVTDGMPLTVSASIGIARVDLAAEPDVEPEQLLRRADAAMYQAKDRGRDRHDVFDSELRDSTEARRVLEQAVQEGLDHDRLALVFQPIVDVDSGTVVGAEALMRLRTVDGRLLPTLPSIVAAEHAGMAAPISDRVLDLALAALADWPAAMRVSVNISTRELDGRDFRTRVVRALRRHRTDPSRLVLEITETSMLRAGPSAVADLERLRDLGVRVSIDDFGTGYATLHNLTVLPVDELKVDASFTACFPGARRPTAVVHGVISMAREMGVPCVVEGVETELQRAALVGLGVRGQGWLFGEPVGPGEVPHVAAQPASRA